MENIKVFTNNSFKNYALSVIGLASSSPASDSDWRINWLKSFLHLAMGSVEQLEIHTELNRHWIGNQYLEYLAESSKSADAFNKNLSQLFYFSYRFYKELEFNYVDDLPIDFRSKLKPGKTNAWSDEEKEEMHYANYLMPINIAKSLIGNDKLQGLLSLPASLNEIVEQKKIWATELDKRVQEVDKLKSALEGYKIGFNFVGLSNGFENLLNIKKKERATTLALAIGLAILMFSPFLVQTIKYWNVTAPDAKTLIWALLPLFGVEFILIYFFRVALHQYRAVTSQVIQLQLRQTLCQFIQSYGEYAKKIKEANPATLDKFESLIFGSIAVTEENIPSTYDGLEQVGKLLDRFKK
ncbi:hypothetical protein ACFX58_06770 [Sphingomonas sp. NCPPB 2930]